MYYGLVAMYVLEDEMETELNLPQGEFDVPIVIADHAFNKDGSFRYEENVDLGFRGDTLLVNGAVSPRMAVQRRRYRLRFLNGSNARSYTLRLGKGRPMLQIAGDGGLLSRPTSRTRVPFHPAERVDFVIDFSAYGPGEEIVLYNEDGAGGTAPIMRFDIEGGRRSEDFVVPSRMRPPEKLPAPNARRRWDLALGSAAWQINGLGFDPNRMDARPRLGSHGAVDLRQPLQPRASDAPARLPVPRARAHQRAGRARRQAGLEGHGRRHAQRDGDRARVVRSLPRQVCLPLPLARTRRQSHDAADGGRLMRVRLAAASAAAVALACPGSALADATIRAVDGTAADNNNNHWDPATPTVKVGEKVTWTFAGTSSLHNVKSTSDNWQLETPFAAAGPDAGYTFTAPGTYSFVCKLHESTMVGSVTVTDETGAPPPPPPPPPLSAQPFVNDAPALTVLEVRDTIRPTLDRVKVSRVSRGARVRFRLSEAGKVAIKLTRNGRRVKTRTVETTRKGTRSVLIRGLKAGRYRVEVKARDLAGNAAKRTTRARITVRS